MPLLASGRQPGLPGRPAFQGGMPADRISADLLQPGHQGDPPLPETCASGSELIVMTLQWWGAPSEIRIAPVMKGLCGA